MKKSFVYISAGLNPFYNQGIQGLVCNGHTGEITGLNRAERKRVVEICSEECGRHYDYHLRH